MLDTAEARGSTAEILEAHSIPHVVSKDMRALGLGLGLLPVAMSAAVAGDSAVVDVAAGEVASFA